ALPRKLIRVEDDRGFFTLWNFHRHNLIFESSGPDGFNRLVLGLCRQFILRFTADVIPIAQVLGCNPHMILVECTSKTVVEHGVLEVLVAHLETETPVLK